VNVKKNQYFIRKPNSFGPLPCAFAGYFSSGGTIHVMGRPLKIEYPGRLFQGGTHDSF
jgi:hypothetical protein